MFIRVSNMMISKIVVFRMIFVYLMVCFVSYEIFFIMYIMMYIEVLSSKFL